MASIAVWPFLSSIFPERWSSCHRTLIGTRLIALHSVEGAGKFPAPKTEQELNAFYLFCPVDDFLVLLVHVFAEVEQYSIVQASKPVGSWMTRLNESSVSKLLSE